MLGFLAGLIVVALAVVTTLLILHGTKAAHEEAIGEIIGALCAALGVFVAAAASRRRGRKR
jgi:hypothetical protein